ncbi:histidine phosphatase family protein [Nocardioides sp.]|uniref:histidine phosphatase family protein n=1 Tax=Nocardioides sp. TaxID=35761 RepID=UPI002B26AB0C|nr:histidine phosphatase family protein [Nocardioides sp.]
MRETTPTDAPRRLVLLRHGRTAWNHAGRVQGQLEVDLDEVGRAQAEQVAAAVAKMSPTRLWCSDLARARQTCEPVAVATGLAPSYDARLREFSFGEREGLTHAEYGALDAEEFDQFRLGQYDACPTAERTAAVEVRMTTVLRELLDQAAPGETVVAVSHGAAIRVATGALLGWPDDQFHSLRGLSNCGWVVLDEHPGARDLRLTAYNRTV